MDLLSDDLNKFDCAAAQAFRELTDQHDMMGALVESEWRASVLKLLTSSLRTSLNLQSERNYLRRILQSRACE